MQAKKLDKYGARQTNSNASRAAIDGNAVTEHSIRERARQIYDFRVAAGQHGDPVSDWLQAERELKAARP